MMFKSDLETHGPLASPTLLLAVQPARPLAAIQQQFAPSSTLNAMQPARPLAENTAAMCYIKHTHSD